MTPTSLEWATAIGTIAAAVVPAVLWFFERRDRKAAEAELRTREAADRAGDVERQARKVFVWKVWGERDAERDGVTMLNTSELPVFDVCLFGYGARSNRQGLDEDAYKEAVLPGTRFGSPSDVDLGDEVWIAFRDASGQEWARNQVGILVGDPDRVAMFEGPPRT